MYAFTVCTLDFPFFFYLPYTLSLPLTIVSLVSFQTARKMTSRLSGLAGTLSSKNSKLYYLLSLRKG